MKDFVYMTRISEYLDGTVHADTMDIIYMKFVLDSVNLQFLANSVFYWHETRFLPSREEHRLSVLDHRFLRKYIDLRGSLAVAWMYIHATARLACTDIPMPYTVHGMMLLMMDW